MVSPHVALLAVHNSPNLGDRAISESLAAAIERNARVVVDRIDLAGRVDPAPVNETSEGLTKDRLLGGRSGLWAMRGLVLAGSTVRIAPRLPLWIRTIARSRAVVIGGGNLLGDEYLNFPYKLFVALTIAKVFRKPVYLYGIGSSPSPTRLGRALFRLAFFGADIRYASAREQSAFDYLEAFTDPALVWDSAITYAAPFVPVWPTKRVLIECMDTSYRNIARGETARDPYATLDYEARMRSIATAAHKAGYGVTLTATGESMDALFAERLARSLPFAVLALPGEAKALCALIAESEVVVASRLHTHVFAAAIGRTIYTVQPVGRKVAEFIERLNTFLKVPPRLVGTPDAMFNPDHALRITSPVLDLDLLEASCKSDLSAFTEQLRDDLARP